MKIFSFVKVYVPSGKVYYDNIICSDQNAFVQCILNFNKVNKKKWIYGTVDKF
jgi:hypothetical protein